ncbi:MAG: tetratricopeptide repeat protein [Spirochaetia bacterium]|nr:tetratricopeptide repeat protein [Spirochaetia bacterium]
MLRFLRTFFGKKSPQNPGPRPEELWTADLRGKEDCRFSLEDQGTYAARLEHGRLELELRRGNLFAWTEAAAREYADAVIEAEIEPAPGGSAGFLFRMSDDSTFMYALVSSSGAVRLDAVFNGEPRPVVPWTDCPWAAGASSMLMTLVMRGRRYLMLLNGRWALEADDDTVEAGRLAFAAQAYDGPGGLARLSSLRVESRPVEVEVEYTRYARVLVPDPDQRRRVAESLFGSGSYTAALVHIRKLGDRAVASDRFLEAECLLRLGLTADAKTALDACLAMEPGHREAMEENYNVLYLEGDYTALRDGLLSDQARLDASPRLLNLLGHAHYNLAAWTDAALAYGRAADLDPAMPLYRRNQATALEKAGRPQDAAGAWLDAAHAFYDQAAWDDAEAASARLRDLRFDEAALDSFDGRVAWARGDLAEAERRFSKLKKRSALDAPGAYIYGLMRLKAGRRADALDLFRQAAALEPSEALYQFRVAESLYLEGLSGQPDFAQALDSALSLAPDDGWSLNLAGQVKLDGGSAAEAEALFRRAAAVLPDDVEPKINLSEALSRLGRLEEALSVLDGLEAGKPAVLNQRGNVLATAGRLEDAALAYEQAVALAGASPRLTEPALPDYLTNLASAYMELGRWTDAEDALRRSLGIREDARAIMLMGDVAEVLGDLVRAETAYRAILQDDPDNSQALRRLARHYLGRARWADAEKTAGRLEPLDPDEAARVMDAVRDATTERLSCASCGRVWTCPKPVPRTPASSLRGELPPDAPAGSCPACGAVYCVACRLPYLEDGRFTCPECGQRLNLNDERVRWLARKSAEGRQ